MLELLRHETERRRSVLARLSREVELEEEITAKVREEEISNMKAFTAMEEYFKEMKKLEDEQNELIAEEIELE
ncbi:hypothetical protein JL09_g6667, partial [Pichia kudriavzevii]